MCMVIERFSKHFKFIRQQPHQLLLETVQSEGSLSGAANDLAPGHGMRPIWVHAAAELASIPIPTPPMNPPPRMESASHADRKSVLAEEVKQAATGDRASHH